ncbi:hypothetical protein DV702_12830 [Sporosarcina sp. PTS2304]|uniref:hypothetical protein n=1 Tax=Sporosarcina sp. PTS2304 TaxID=2283194 RepID=UPI000E0D2BB2|nr:hypothetical protein [Sporosarcina sp. PTS2304]AXI00526.1 hypothetical protein DV702_12830 [Sporosarcina sp. PTS2304]
MKRWMSFVLIVFVSLISVACQQNEAIKERVENTVIPTSEVEMNESIGLQVNSDIVNVRISTFTAFDKMNTDVLIGTEEKETLKVMQQAIANAVRQPGIVGMAATDYDIEVVFADGSAQGYHLWLGEKGQKSTIMRVDDTHTIYTVSREMTDQLLEVIQ